MNIQKCTNYLCTLPLPHADSILLLEKCMNLVGKVKKIDKETGIIIGRFRVSSIYSVKMICTIQQKENPAIVFSFSNNALIKTQDKRWYQVAKQIQLLIGENPLGIDVTDHATRITKIIRIYDSSRWCVYNNGRIKVMPPKLETPPPPKDNTDDLDWIDRIEEMDALFGD